MTLTRQLQELGQSLWRTGCSGKRLFIELALEDLRRAADLFRPVFDASQHIDGWVSTEVSRLLAGDTNGSIAAPRQIHLQADRPSLFVKIPGHRKGSRPSRTRAPHWRTGDRNPLAAERFVPSRESVRRIRSGALTCTPLWA